MNQFRCQRCKSQVLWRDGGLYCIHCGNRFEPANVPAEPIQEEVDFSKFIGDGDIGIICQDQPPRRDQQEQQDLPIHLL